MTLNELLAHELDGARRGTLDTFKDFAEKDLLFRPKPDMNHALWLLGHIANSEDHLILEWCAGAPQLPQEYAGLFGIGSKPQDKLSAYPPVRELLERMAKVHEAVLAYIRAMPDGELARPNRCLDKLPERPRQMFASRGQCILHHLAHEAAHGGQMAYLRRMLGKPPRV